MVTPTESLVVASGGDWLLTLVSILVIVIIGTFVFLVRWICSEIPKQWQMSADKIVSHLSIVMNQQTEIARQIENHDKRADSIGEDVSQIKIILERRPCINGNGK